MSFPYTISDKAVSVFVDGKPRVFPSTHPSFDMIKEAIMASDWDEVRTLSDVKATVAVKTFGRVKILDTEIEVDGRVVSGKLVDRILEMVRLGNEAIGGYVAFLDNLLENPSKRAVDELYLFIEACDLPITDDGHFLAYKIVRSDYTDRYSGKFDNSVGQVCEMIRNEVCDDRERTCAEGLHFCSQEYLPQYGGFYGSGGDSRFMVVKVNPADVVSIPSDYNNAKGRTWKYEVVGELDHDDVTITPWFTDEYTNNAEDDLTDFDSDFNDFIDEEFDDLDKETLDMLDGDDSRLNDIPLLDDQIEPAPTPEPIDTSDVDTADGDYSQKLSWKNVRQMRRLFLQGDVTLTEIAEQFNVSRRQAARIRDNESWVEQS